MSSSTTPIRGNSINAMSASSIADLSSKSTTTFSSAIVGNKGRMDTTAAVASTNGTAPVNTTTSGRFLLSQQQSQEESSSLSISSAAAAVIPTSVTRERKETLLQQARADRLQWIRKVPLPYQPQPQQPQPQPQRDENNGNNNNNNDDDDSSLWHQDERLRQLKNSHAVQQLPTALTVLSHLYGIQNANNNNNNNQEETVQEIGDRVASIIADSAHESTLAVPTAEQTRLQAAELQLTLDRGGDYNINNNNSGGGGDDPDIVLAYHSFVTHLTDPVCAMLVQGMRSFCRNLKTSTTTTTSSVDKKDQVVRKLQAYLDSTMETIQQQHAAWMQQQQQQQDQNSHTYATPTTTTTRRPTDYVRRSLDSFIYGQCHEFITSLLYWDETAKAKEKEWLERIDSLQFVNASHLEIAGLDQNDNEHDEKSDHIHQLLQEPINALLSVNRHHAPFEKLQRILAVYRGVNAALYTALNQNRNNDNNNDRQQQQQHPKRLPSADDVLPTIILTVLKARPERLLVNLQLVEDFLPASHLRAEAGYALTTLHGAVAFIQDFNLEQEPQSLQLAMDPNEFRKGLEACRKTLEDKRAAAAAAAATTAEVTCRDPLAAVIDVEPSEVYSIPVQEVRAARLRGEVVDMDWAMRWQAQQQQQQQTEGAAYSVAVTYNDTSPTRTNTVVDELTEGLPTGFTRNYTFLATRPEDVRMADLPRLLSEYRMLVQATESLLAERLAKHAAERKAQRMQRQKELYARARQLDPSLIPASSSSSNNKSNGGTTKKTNDRSRDS